jgi:hypothetical protein
MHTLTVQTAFTFGDRVSFDSATQGRSGSGEIFAVTIDANGLHDYMIRVDGQPELQPGILESEITLF